MFMSKAEQKASKMTTYNGYDNVKYRPTCEKSRRKSGEMKQLLC